MSTRTASGMLPKRALDVQPVQRLVEDPAAGRLRGVPQFDRDDDLDLLGQRVPLEVDVQHLLAEVVPLEFLDQHRLGLAVEGEGERPGVLDPDGPVELDGVDGDVGGGSLCPYTTAGMSPCLRSLAAAREPIPSRDLR